MPRRKPDHDGKVFRFPGEPLSTSGWDALKWAVTRKPAKWPARLENPPTDPVVERVAGDQLRVTFINHATVLIQTQGLNLLTDPVFSRRVSPVRFAGPARHRAVGIEFDELPPIDVVMVSHCHYDHLDARSLERLQARDVPRFLVPLKNRSIIDADSSRSVTELDWWESERFSDEVSVSLVPARHWSSRSLGDANRALWGGFAINLPGGAVYFAGDTGYGDGSHFVAAREALGPFRLALLPIGAYEPRWFMKPQHMNPAEAVKAFRDLRCQRALGIHFGTFQLTDEPHDAPERDLATALQAHGVEPANFRTLGNGQAWDIPTG